MLLINFLFTIQDLTPIFQDTGNWIRMDFQHRAADVQIIEQVIVLR